LPPPFLHPLIAQLARTPFYPLPEDSVSLAPSSPGPGSPPTSCPIPSFLLQVNPFPSSPPLFFSEPVLYFCEMGLVLYDDTFLFFFGNYAGYGWCFVLMAGFLLLLFFSFLNFCDSSCYWEGKCVLSTSLFAFVLGLRASSFRNFPTLPLQTCVSPPGEKHTSS